MSATQTIGVPTAQSESKARLWTGRIISSLVVLSLLFDGITKVVKERHVLQAAAERGYSADAMVAIGTLLLACTLVYVIPRTAILGAVLLTGYLGAVMQGSAFLAVGLLASSLTESQIVSAVVSFVVLLALWLSDNIGQAAGGLFGQIVGYTSLINHIQGFSQGVIDSKDVVFYLTVIGAGLVLSTLSLQSKRYR